MCHFHALRQAVRIDGKAVIVTGNFDMLRVEIFHRLIAAAMTEFQLVRPAAQGEAQQLMAEANAEERHAAQ